MENKNQILKFIRPNLVPVIILLLIPFIGTFFGLIILLAKTIPSWSRANKSIAALENKGELDQAAAEFSFPAKILMKGNLVLTEHYVFCKKTGIVLSYDQIQWAYKYRHTTSFLLIPIVVQDYLYLATKDMKPRGVAVMGKDKNEEIKAAIIEIYNHNRNCLIGYSKENTAQYKVLAKQ